MSDIKRREFVSGACATLAAATMLNPSAALAARNNPELQTYNKVKLIGPDGKPLKAATLKDGESFIFNYPYVSSPAFLINTGIEVKPSGEWTGGVGNKKAIVGFAAICSHLLSYPKKKLSALAYRPTKEGKYATKGQVITCCAHGSAFDVEAAGKKMTGPATAALSAILLEHDASDDSLTATAVWGAPWIHKKFLKRMKKDLRKVYGRSEYKSLAEGTAQIRKLSDITENIAKC